jgi:multicomponent Na+:H+ antiporter subunit E
MIGSFLKRLLLFLLLWTALTGAVWRDPVIAGGGLIATAIFSLALWPPVSHKLRWRGLPALLGHFLRASILGGIDIAYRALAPSMPINPGFIEFRSQLTDELSVVLFVWMISLMPGSATVRLEDGGGLTVHIVDRDMYGEKVLRVLEQKIAGFIKQ